MGGLLRSRDTKPMDTKLGKVLTYCERLPLLKPHDPFIRCPTSSHMTIWEIMATKLGGLLTSGISFSTQMLKLSPTYCLFCFFRKAALSEG